jgi:hypothetical protein
MQGCTPGKTKPCYSGPAGTEGVGICKGGTATCNAQGDGYGDCAGETLPAPADDCAAKIDADCDGRICGEAVWAFDFPGPDDQLVNAVATDAAGNLYVAGQVRGSIAFGAAAGETLVSAGQYDAFVAKLDPSGKFLWGKSLGDATSNQSATAIAVDGGGAVVVGGWLVGSMSFGAKTLTASGPSVDAFVAKLDAAGSLVWALSYGDGAAYHAVNAVAVDSQNDILVAGTYSGSIDLGKGAMTATGQQDLFVAKLTGATGAAQWSQRAGDVGQKASAGALAVDANGGCAMVGTFFGGYVERLDAFGNVAWTATLGDNESHANGVALDSAGNVYVAGTSKIVAGPGPTFVVKLDGAGNQKWAKGAAAAAPYAIATDAAGNSFVVGSLNAAADFGGGLLTGPAFLWKLGADGSHAFSRVYGTGTSTNVTASEACRAVALAPGGAVVVACENQGTMDFGSGPVMGTMGLDVTLAKIAAQ